MPRGRGVGKEELSINLEARLNARFFSDYIYLIL